jgi:hypothetical protein
MHAGASHQVETGCAMHGKLRKSRKSYIMVNKFDAGMMEGLD